jgi:hypothetical protein
VGFPLAFLPSFDCHARRGITRAQGVGRRLIASFTNSHNKIVALALANKMARTAWALLAHGGTYRAPRLAAAA